jgi:adenylate kinase
VNLIIFGPPGAGKGTQADKIVTEFNLNKISTGDLLRDEISKNTTLGKEIKKIIDKGSFVTDETINNLIKKIFSNNENHNRLIFDGYPRNLNQTKNLDHLLKKNKQSLTCVLSLNVPEDVVVKRILGRQVCTKCSLIFNKFFNPSNKKNHNCGEQFLTTRSDDKEEVIIKRYKTYIIETLPILNFYKNLDLLYEIDGIKDIDSIYKEIRQILHSLDG